MLDLKRDGYYIIRPEHTSAADVEFVATVEAPSLEELYKLIGCDLVELVHVAERGFVAKPGGLFGHVWEPQGTSALAFVDEEGMDVQPPNALATGYTRLTTALSKANIIFGTMVVCCGRAQPD